MIPAWRRRPRSTRIRYAAAVRSHQILFLYTYGVRTEAPSQQVLLLTLTPPLTLPEGGA